MYLINENDETLVMLTLAGDQRAYEGLVKKHQKTVVASAFVITKSQFMAEDAAQDAFVTAWMKLNTLQDASKYCSWVCRIAKNCAINMINRYRSFLPVDFTDGMDFSDCSYDPSKMIELSEDREDVKKSIEKLPERIRQIIYLHYFEDMPISEIADRMRISEGTVKWQLHDGRKRIRKELCAMDEKYSDNLVERVMKKVEELKLWQTKNDKTGFEKIYKNVLRDVEELPESIKKKYALADVLLRGWWWLPGEKNDALFARIRASALEGKNDDVMDFVVTREDGQVYGGAKIEFIRDKQIPLLEKAGLVKTLAREWFWLGYHYFRSNQVEKGNEAFDKAESLLTPADRYYALVMYAREVEEKMQSGYREKNLKRFLNNADADELRWIDGKLHYWKMEQYGEGYLNSIDRNISNMFFNISRCDGLLFDETMSVGETRVGTDDTTLTFVSDNEVIDTPCGTFEKCQLWKTSFFGEYSGYCVEKAWYKSGVGIVKYERKVNGLSDFRILKSYKIVGGEGILPLVAGNTWEYSDLYDHNYLSSELKFTVTHADERSVVIASRDFVERFGYDSSSWLDMIQQIRNEYWIYENGSDHGKLGDISLPLETVESLAKTPLEKAHSKAAVSVVKRIVEGETPNSGYKGHWNFFAKYILMNKNGQSRLSQDHRWSFELKYTSEIGEPPYLYNDIYSILQDATNCIWSDEWIIGASPIVESTRWDNAVKTKITCETGGMITTKAGCFYNCFKLDLEIDGMHDGVSYRGGRKTYYFANGIGIVRVENEYAANKTVYELSEYDGVGEGYMPIEDGFVRRYEALGLTDGYVAGVEYSYVRDSEGHIVIFKDAIGIRKELPPITLYSSIQSEKIEDQLWNEGKYEESRQRHDINNFKLLCHFLGRPSRYWAEPEKAVAWNKYRLSIMESLGADNTPPSAWLGLYTSTTFRLACALFGSGKNEEGYEYLEKAFEIYPKWASIEDGAELNVGDPLIYGDIKLIKGRSVIKLSDGTNESLIYDWIFHCAKDLMYYGMTAPHGWEWFNSVRNDDRFKSLVEVAKKISES